MATYPFISIQNNLLGDTSITLNEDSINGGMALLLNNIGNEKYIFKEIRVWSTDQFQLDNGIDLAIRDVNGNYKNVRKGGNVDSYQFQNKIVIDCNNYPLSEDSKIGYVVNGLALVRLTFVVDTSPEIVNKLSYSAMMDVEAGKDNFKSTVIDGEGFKEAEEKSEWTPTPVDQSFKEPEEQKPWTPQPVDTVFLKQQINMAKMELPESEWGGVRVDQILQKASELASEKETDWVQKASDTFYLMKQDNMDEPPVSLEKEPVISKEPTKIIAKKPIAKPSFETDLIILLSCSTAIFFVLAGEDKILKQLFNIKN
jgi:hypothetical protein